MKEFSFDQIPEAVNRIETKLIEIEQLLSQLAMRSSPASDDLMTDMESAFFLRVPVLIIYGLICRRELPVRINFNNFSIFMKDLAVGT